jgi:hypothetical protein
MGGTDGHEIPMPDIPVYVYVVSGLLVASILGTQLLGIWLTGFKKPVPLRSDGFGSVGGSLKPLR